MLNLVEVSELLTQRVVSIFAKDDLNGRKLNGKYNWFYSKPGNEDLVLFFEYFHGDNGSGLGASHQTGWTALVADLIGGREVPMDEWIPQVKQEEEEED
jgi:poly(3-hydroxybutyrate) depolymerase